MNSGYITLLVEQADGVCSVTMNRPGQAQRDGPGDADELGDAFLEIAGNRDALWDRGANNRVHGTADEHRRPRANTLN